MDGMGKLQLEESRAKQNLIELQYKTTKHKKEV